MTGLERLGALAVTLASAAVVLGHRYLAMNDAPQHLATAVIAQGVARGDAFLTRHYALPPSPVPYWMTTLLTLPLLSVLPPYRAFAVAIAVYALALPLSVWYLARVLGREESALLAMLAALAVFNHWYWAGSTNYLYAQPLLLLALAALVRAREGRRFALPTFFVLAALVYLCHLYALGALLVAVGAFAAADLYARRPSRPTLMAMGWASFLFLAAALMVVVGGGERNRGWPDLDLSPAKALRLVTFPFESPGSDVLPWVAVAGGGLALALGWSVVRRHAGLRDLVDPKIAAVAVLLIVGAAFGPSKIRSEEGTAKESEIADRLVLPGFLMAVAALRIPRAARPLVFGLALVAGAAKVVDAQRLHAHYDREIGGIVASVVDRLPRHARLLCIKDLSPAGQDRQQFYQWIGLYAVVERDAYVPNVFAAPGQQALRHRLALHRPRLSDLGVSDSEWAFYDHVLLQTDRDGTQVPGLAAHAHEIAASGDFRLYATTSAAGPAAAAATP